MAEAVTITFNGPPKERQELLSAVYRALYPYPLVSAMTRSRENEISVIVKSVSVPPPSSEVKKGEINAQDNSPEREEER